MEETTQQTPDRYAQVSSLYGPGTVACWYLTILSVFVSWTLHPKKRKSGSIDVDLIALLTLPAVAAGHLCWQVSMLISRHDTSPNMGVKTDEYAQSIAAIEAPFSVIESFMAISVILFLVALWTVSLRRAICVATVGLLCLATECHIHFSRFGELGIRFKRSAPESDKTPAFSRSFVADFTGLVIAILVILAISAVGASAIITYMLHGRRARQEIEETRRQRLDQNPGASQGAVHSETATSTHEPSPPNALSPRSKRTSGWVAMTFGFAAMLLTIVPSAGNAIYFSYTILAATRRKVTIWSRVKIFVAHFYPHSSNSFLDLDQAVATAAGATVLGFSIYSVAKAQYELQGRRRATRVGDDQD